jgi:hypothetical protein
MIANSHPEGDITTTSGWDKFFSPASYWQTSYPDELNDMKLYWDQASKLLLNGLPNNVVAKPEIRRNRISYYCRNPDQYTRCGTDGV